MLVIRTGASPAPIHGIHVTARGPDLEFWCSPPGNGTPVARTRPPASARRRTLDRATWAVATLAWSLLALGGGYATAESPIPTPARQAPGELADPVVPGDGMYVPAPASGGALSEDQSGFAITLRKCLRSVFRALIAYPAIPSRLPPRVVRLDPPRVRDRGPDPVFQGQNSTHRSPRSHLS